MATLMFVLAHPDDESFGAGGTIARYARRGHRVVLVCATRGEAGKCGDPPLCRQEELGEVRERELRAAAEVLGISRVEFLGYRDKEVLLANPAEIVGKIVQLLKEERPEALVTFGPDGISGHVDHRAISHFATLAFWSLPEEERPARLYYYAWEQGVREHLQLRQALPSLPVTTVLDVGEWVEVKKQALLCHRTQHLSLERVFFSLTEEQLQKALSKEGFHRVWPVWTGGEKERGILNNK
ncbi:N-acetylglucosaminyl deacetylase, LmbE family [Carboxydocella sporoproducens DSM 16521]|uniref:N-acetylglucosaminyl deacetylase, LmbE family n=2 Tax=Carboxydocella TaxID=178898 RepID=A0A1T4MEZ4_9FIRM|nr:MULTISPECIES: PIG-L deacetylase family protein [Carboxydocella]AVX21299.1 N-acetylglucosaminyl deacetylase, LmbE family [Carboxydocella thermautotrophica]SJZ65483.1 N-acetylglucosaminyl deacetylase, LmbE family [Carboxydocella sporoproducens DSM 16521]